MALHGRTPPRARVPAPGAAASRKRLLFTRPLLSHCIYYFYRFATRGCLPGGIPLSPVAAKAKINGCSVAVVPGVTQEPPHALHSLHCALPTFSLWLPPFNSVEND
jgi:hypothetical protein